ncbi:hypothetical protein B0T14DRAFT_423608 [Immersiella caudata]|uniref:Tetratricopeptide repeat protein 36 n=1 Tax=Immersiella caudata TaxID=314043 RepID=A0AA39X2E0_9PEZI|nr:hypothetical protein B0T14DRAFT_423608 [Immersiella caudata]
MASLSLSRRDMNVLGKIQDPESDPSMMVYVDSELPKDPHIRDLELYGKLAQEERDIIMSIQKLETQNVQQKSTPESNADIIERYRDCVARFGELIEQHPHYASARNNRTQALRRLSGDSMLVAQAPQPPQALLREVGDAQRLEMARTVLGDLDQAIILLTPAGRYPRMSPQAARTLSLAHTQRAAIYLATSKLMELGFVPMPTGRWEENWSKIKFEENASRDFAMGGRYGNEIAKGLAVSTNPTAKLCGQMVRGAMKKEYGPDFGA